MKNSIKIEIITISLLLAGIMLPSDMYAKGGEGWRRFRKGVKQFFGSVAESTIGAVCQQSCVNAGYSQEEATNMTRNALEFVGFNTQNVDKGIAYVNADNKYERQNLVKDGIFDVAAEVAPNSQLLEYFRQTTDAQLTYLSERTRATTDEERKAAFDKKSRTYAYITYDTYQYAKEKRAQILAEKMQIKKQLEAKGYDSGMAAEIAGNIFAIQKSDLPEDEKERLLRSYGFSESPAEIREYVNEIMNETSGPSAQTEQARLEAEKREAERLEAERSERERIEAERRAAEEKRIAIDKITHISPSNYKFDEVELSDSQKKELDEVASVMSKYSDVTILLTGHTCKIGYKSINQRKGLQRANVAKNYLVKSGITEERILTNSKGETDPITDNNTPTGRSKNRRVEISIIQ